ncbi:MULTISPECIES: DNA polymerase Y family protein [unclassified Rubrivivax]|uniref:Y-family DNA polymerase n=1 Tax=unclassified Rubrivivax TaxID=2649762 RepID=UPI001E3A7659|nr:MULTISPECIES: DNA polymerase Y family protein [unclassified Rubrivivax]MCC9598189.1 DNA polymerase Y family protein [Rubrivivax sp. JA1055]MCC9645555.1 DNA polymerase Y family protein [Rubrivivax sp. JA1029]
MFWIALHAPRLSLESWRATLGAAEAARPLALLAAHRIAVVDRRAAERGVQPGMRRGTALALAPDLVHGEADAVRDAAALTALAHAALAFTPMVVPEPPATVLLEVAASLRCFGGGPRLLQRLQAAVEPLGHALAVASAPTARAASLLARWRGDQTGFMLLPGDRLAALQAVLAGAPLALLDAGREHAAVLQGMGVHTLGELQALPRDGVARRFGTTLLAELDQTLGRTADPREPLVPPGVFESRLELFARADTAAQVLHGAGVLLARLVAWAQARQVRIVAFTLGMRHDRCRGDAPPATRLRLELAEPSLDPGHLQLLLRERLGRLELVAPTLELELECRETVHAPAPNAELFPSRQSQDRGLVRLLERLRARLGDEQVLHLAPQPDHRPECGTRLLPLGSAPARPVPAGRRSRRAPSAPPPEPSAAPPAAETDPAQALIASLLARAAPVVPEAARRRRAALHRPVWLLEAPQPLPERHERPQWQGRPLRVLAGPERIESGWWDGGLAVRDYFVAQAEDGALVWVYRERLPADDAAGGWYLQGWFG